MGFGTAQKALSDRKNPRAVIRLNAENLVKRRPPQRNLVAVSYAAPAPLAYHGYADDPRGAPPQRVSMSAPSSTGMTP